MKLTIFTPTYNRAHTLPAIYESLVRQTSRDFDWLVVDDGSTDGTENLMKEWEAQKKISMRYLRQLNGGKHRAINRALKEPCGYLFMIVDSDDRLAHEGVVEEIVGQVPFLEQHPDFCAVVGNRVHEDGHIIGTESHYEVLDSNFVEYREKYNIVGDRAEVVKTSVMREFPFPEIEGEKFCPEGYIWTDMARKYRARYFNLPWVVCEYLPDGLSYQSVKLYHANPVGSMLTLTKCATHPDTGWINSTRFTAQAWHYSFDSDLPFRTKIGIIGPERLWVLPIAVLYRFLKTTLGVPIKWPTRKKSRATGRSKTHPQPAK